MINGSIGVASNWVSSSEVSQQSPTPFYWNAFASVNMKIYGWSIPLSATFADTKFSFSKPKLFQRYGMSPTYKWVTLHLGWRSISFSPFILNGQTFLGGGIEINPKKFRAGIIYGEFKKAQAEDTTSNKPKNYLGASYKRMGYAARIGLGTKNNFFDLVYLHIADDIHSIPTAIKDTALKGQENAVGGFNSQFKFFKHITWQSNAALSAFTSDIRSNEISSSNNSINSFLQNIITPRYSTLLQGAAETNVAYVNKSFSFKTGYRFISPFYRSLGIVSYLADDMGGKAQLSFPLLKNKIRFSSGITADKNNVMNQKAVTVFRNSGNCNIAINPSNKWGIDLSYNIFTNRQVKTVATFSDSILQRINNQGISVSPHFTIIKTNFSNTVIGLVTNQFSTTTGLNAAANQNNILVAMITNVYTNLKKGYGISGGITYSQFNSAYSNSNNQGINLSANKSFFENKLSIGYSNGLQQSLQNQQLISTSFVNNLNLSYVPNKHHSFNFSGGINFIQSYSNYTNLHFLTSYTYSF